MLNLKTLEDVNKYYRSKDIEPYWTFFEDKYLLRLDHIIGITKIFDMLIKLYPNVRIDSIGDFYKYEKYLYDYFYKGNSLMVNPTYEIDMIGVEYDFMVGGRFIEKDNFLIINHNSLHTVCNNLEKICEVMVHEFYHALDNTYKIYMCSSFKEFYTRYTGLEDYNDRQMKEFGAKAFISSFFNKKDMEEDEIRVLIDCIINK